MPDNNNTTPRILRWLKQQKTKAHGAVVAAFAVSRAAQMAEGQRVVVICHGMKAVNRVLAHAENMGVTAKQWKSGEPLPKGVPLVVADFAATGKRKAFHAEVVVFEVYAGGSRQKLSEWAARFHLVGRHVPEVAIYVKTHSLPDETEVEEQERAAVHERLMGVEMPKIRGDKDRGKLSGRAANRSEWGSRPRAAVRALAETVFQATIDEELQPVLTGQEISALLQGATQKYIDWARGTDSIKELEAWVGSTLSDAAVLSELKYRGLTNARALNDVKWGAERQKEELWDEEFERPFAERSNVFVRRRHLHHLLTAAKIAVDVSALRPVLVSREMTRAVGAAVPWANPGARRDMFRVLGLTVYGDDHIDDEDESEKSVTIQRVLRRCGYAPTDTRVEVRGEDRRWWSFTPLTISEQVQPPTPTTPGFCMPPEKSLLNTVIGIFPAPCRNGEKPRFDGHVAQKKRREGVTVLLAPGIESSGLGVAGTEKDNERRTNAMKALLSHATPLEGEPGGCGWKQVTLPGPALWRPRRLSDRLIPDWAGNTPNFARGHVYAPPGTVFVNFDFKSCHFRIAQRILAQAQPRSTFFSNLFDRGDVYSAIAGDLDLSRDDAKLVALKLLNGAERSTLEPILGARAASVLAAWKKNNPWVSYCAALTAKIRDTHNKRSYIACMMQKVEAQLLEATLVHLDTQSVPFSVVLPLFDGGLLVCQAEDAERLKLAVEASGKAAAAALGMPEMGMEVGVGITWKEAQEGA